jgi:hypothetical protein
MRVARRLSRSTAVRLNGLGHLMHEEDPARVGAAIRDWLLLLPDQPSAARICAASACGKGK